VNKKVGFGAHPHFAIFSLFLGRRVHNGSKGSLLPPLGTHTQLCLPLIIGKFCPNILAILEMGLDSGGSNWGGISEFSGNRKKN